MIEMVRRQQVAQATMTRFRGRILDLGRDDCARLGAFVLRKMGWRSQLARAGSYSTVLGATRAMKRAGFDDLAQAVDAHGLQRIAPASALPADLIMLPGGEPFGGALTMAVGNGRVLGWHQDIDFADVLQPVQYVAAWRTVR